MEWHALNNESTDTCNVQMPTLGPDLSNDTTNQVHTLVLHKEHDHAHATHKLKHIQEMN